MHLPRPVSAVLFDLDGTLIDSFRSHYRVYQAVFADLRLPFDETAYVQHYSPNWYQFYERLGVANDRWAEADRLWLHYYSAERPDERPGASELLRTIHDSRRPMGLVTSGDRSRVEPDLERMGWSDLFQVVVCGGEVPERKPHPAALRHALRRLEQQESAAVYVGDTIEDVMMGKSAGVMTVALLGGFSSREALEGARPDLILDAPSALAGIF